VGFHGPGRANCRMLCMLMGIIDNVQVLQGL
jgi:hypothetical protein